MTHPVDGATFQVVVNDEQQYSLWPTHRALPDGWRAEGTRGDRESCLARIGEVWQDLRPLSLRQRISGGRA